MSKIISKNKRPKTNSFDFTNLAKKNPENSEIDPKKVENFVINQSLEKVEKIDIWSQLKKPILPKITPRSAVFQNLEIDQNDIPKNSKQIWTQSEKDLENSSRKKPKNEQTPELASWEKENEQNLASKLSKKFEPSVTLDKFENQKNHQNSKNLETEKWANESEKEKNWSGIETKIKNDFESIEKNEKRNWQQFEKTQDETKNEILHKIFTDKSENLEFRDLPNHEHKFSNSNQKNNSNGRDFIWKSDSNFSSDSSLTPKVTLEKIKETENESKNSILTNQKTNLLPFKSFESDMNPSERKLLLTSNIYSKQDEIDQHLAKRSPEEDLDNWQTKMENQNKPENHWQKINSKSQTESQNNSATFDAIQKPRNLPKNSFDTETNKPESEFEKIDDLDEFPDFGANSRKRVNQEFDLEKHNWNNKSSQQNSQKSQKSEFGQIEGNNQENELEAKNQEIIQTGEKNYRLQQKKSEFNLILKIISFGCLLAVLLFYFQGLQPLILWQITAQNQKKIQELSQNYQTKVGSYFELTQNLASNLKSDSESSCQKNNQYQNLSNDTQKIENLINKDLKPNKTLEKVPKFWFFRNSQIDAEYKKTLEKYQENLAIYNSKSDYLVDYLYFLEQRNFWLSTCQDFKNTSSLVRFEEICQEFTVKNQDYKQKRKSKFWNSLDTLLQSFETLCKDLNTTQSPTKWRSDWLSNYVFLTKYVPQNDNDKLYQLNEQTLVEFQNRSRNVANIYEQRTNGIGYLYILDLEN